MTDAELLLRYFPPRPLMPQSVFDFAFLPMACAWLLQAFRAMRVR